MRAKVILFLLLLVNVVAQAQTNPTAVSLPFTMTSGSSIPAGMALWRFGTSNSIPTSRITTAANGDLPISGQSNSGGYSLEGSNGIGMLASGSQNAGAFVVAINTTGLTNITVSWVGRTILNQASRDNYLGLQYRIGTTGNFTDVTPLVSYFTGGASTANVEVLPAAANNQPVVQVRWLYWETGTSGSRDRLALDDVSITGSSACTPPTASIAGGTAVCSGSSTNITITGTPGATVTYDINNGSDLTVVLTGGSAVINTGAVTATRTYRLLNAVLNGCNQALNTTAVVTVNPLPTATLSASQTICIGSSTNVTITGTPNAVITYNIDGNPSQNVTLSSGGTATVNTGTVNGDITVSLENASLGSCSQALTASTNIDVVQLPTVAVSGTANICTGGNTDITFAGTPGGATVTYTVNNGSNQTVVLDNFGNATVNTTALTGDAVYDLVSVSYGSCVQPATGSATVTVINATASISGTTSICAGSDATITFTGTPGATVNYLLNGTNQTVALDLSGSATVNTGTLTADATYTLVDVTSGPCTRPATGTATVTVNNPTATISGTATICSGGNADITFTGTANATVSYTVNGSAQTVLLNNAGSATVNSGPVTNNTTYTLVDVVSGPCTSTLTGSAVISVGSPTATISGTTTVCEGATAVISFNGTPTGTVTYTIDNGPAQTVLLDGSGDATVTTAVLTTATTYQLVSIDAGTCSAPLTGSAVISVNSLPIASISGATTICSGTGTNITFTGTPGATVTYNTNGTNPQTIVLLGGSATLPTGNLSTTTTYSLVSVSQGTCSQSQTGSAVVAVNTTPTASISGTTAICSGTGTNITFTGTAGATVTYNVNGINPQTIVLTGGTATLPTGNLTNTTTYNLVSVSLNSCTATPAGAAVVTVNTMPVASIGGAATICSGTGTDITFTGTAGATVTYNVNGINPQTIVLTGGSATLPTGNLSNTTTYNLVSVSLGTCSQPQTGSAVVTVNTTPTASISGATTICSGTGTNITFTGTTGATVTYNVNGINPQTIVLTGGTATLPTGNLTSTTTYNIVSATLNSCPQTLTGSAVVTVNPIPTANISGTTTICSGTGTNITFTGTAGATVTYNVNGINPQTIVLTGGTATLPTGNLTSTTTYNIVSATLNSCPQTLTGSAVVTVNPIPTANIAGTTTICSGNSATITFTGTPNATVTYNINGNGPNIIAISGTGLATVSTGPLTATAVYALVSVSLNSCSQNLSNTATVTVNPLPTATIAGTTTICSGTGTNITFTGTPGATVTYNTNGVNPQTIVLTGGTATLPTGNLSANTTYNLVSVILGTCTQPQTGSAVVTVNSLPTATISGTATICSGNTATITINGTPNAVVAYNIDGGISTNVTLSSTGTATLTTAVLTANATYNLVSASLNSCSQPQTGSAVITVTPLPTATISGTATICSGNSATVTFNGTPNATITYTVNNGTNQTVNLNGVGTGTVNSGVLTSDAIFNLVSANGNGCSQTITGTATITVNALPVVSISGTTAICAGTSTDITLTGTPNATVDYKLNNTLFTTTLNASGNATISTGNITADATYELESVSEGLCSQSVTGTAVVTVNALPTATISGTTAICSGTAANITITGTPNATVVYTVNGGTNQNVTLDVAGLATINSGNLTTAASYALVSINDGTCGNTLTGNANITINPIPAATISGTTNICTGNGVNITFNGTPNATVFYTINSGPQLSTVLDGTGNSVVNTGVLTGNAVYSLVSASLNSCTGNASGAATVTVSPTPMATISGNATLAAGNIADIIFTGTPNAIVTYTINGGAAQTITLDGTGNAAVTTGVLFNTMTYALVDVTLGCTASASGSAVVNVSTAYGTLYTYTNDVNGDFNFVATNATATDLTLFNGTAVSGTPCPSGFTTDNYSSAVTFDPAVNGAVTTKITPDGMNRLIITGFTVGVRSSVDGPQSVRLAYSLDNGANWISSGVDEIPGSGACGNVTTLTWNVTPFQIYPNADGIIFGVFGFNASATTGQLQIVDMGVNGAVIDNPLPIKLTYFKAACAKGDITCKWAVSYEENISEYQVEFSADGKRFNKVATIAPYGNQGIGDKLYSTTVYNGAEGLYRLASVEMNGTKDYSKAVAVKCDDNKVSVATVVNVIDGTLNMWPGSEFTLGANIDVQLFNMNGALIAKYSISANGAKQQQQVSLPAGVYMVRMTQGNAASAHKVVIQ